MKKRLRAQDEKEDGGRRVEIRKGKEKTEEMRKEGERRGTGDYISVAFGSRPSRLKTILWLGDQ